MTKEQAPAQADAGVTNERDWFSRISWVVVTLIVFAIIYAVAYFIGSVALVIYPVARHWDSSQAVDWLSNSIIAQFWGILLIDGLIIFLTAFYLKILRHFKLSKFSLKSLGLRGKPKGKDIGYGVIGFGAYFGILLVIYLVIMLIHALHPAFNANNILNQKQDIGFHTTSTGLILIPVFVALVIIAPIAEEIFFRGYLYTFLRSNMPKIGAALVVSVIFASFHLVEGSNNSLLWIGAIDTFTLSLTLVYLRQKTGRLWSSILVHMIKNGLAFSFLYLVH